MCAVLNALTACERKREYGWQGAMDCAFGELLHDAVLLMLILHII
jgi:hypothetical protein